MKGTENPTLSSYLLEKANRFLLYPQRSHSNWVRETYDQARRKMVEWRKTFAPQDDSGNEIVKILCSPKSLDELYCRELLTAVPGVVERTLSLSHFTLTDVSDSEFVHLREAANCYIFGLPLAAVALARAAAEEALRKKLEIHFGKKAIAEADFKDLINDYGSRTKILSKEGRTLANKVRMAGNDVLHQQGTFSGNPLEIIEAAREVILELAGKAKRAGASKGA